MRTKTLLLTAAVGMVGMATSYAQVYSVNAVGYVNLTLRSTPTAPATLGTIIASPLNGTNNNLNTILPLPDAYDGTTIYRFNVGSQNYLDGVLWVTGFGWYNPADPNGTPPDINPGEGFWIFPVGPSPLNVTFVGDVPQGHLVNSLPPAGKLSLLGSIVPQSAAIGDTATPTSLQFNAEESDTIYVFNSATQLYKDQYDYVGGYGWFSQNGDDPGPAGPTIPVATGFFVKKAATATQTSWVRDFSVN
jgi:hypothetical protein